MSDTQNEPLPGEKAIKVKKAGPILLGADRYDIFEKGQKAIREFVEHNEYDTPVGVLHLNLCMS